MRDKLISAVLKHLTIKRPLDADRAEFFAFAEVGEVEPFLDLLFCACNNDVVAV